ncbi:MAG: Fis family transcriptional regulator [Rhodobacterales bacterium]|nr:MAG: Fis family transcriptional regulator [Rhodobacterales bacterium]
MNRTSPPRSILVVEDDRSLNTLLLSELERKGYEMTGAMSCAEARAVLETMTPDLILIDIRLPDCNGLELLVEFAPRTPVITMTAYGAVDQAVKAVRTGASDYLVKPVSYEALELAIERALETAELKRDLAYWQQQAQQAAFGALIGDSPPMAEMRRMIELYSAAGSEVLIEGESGAGKELVARAIHEASDRAGKRFVPVDCDLADESSLIADLFGYERGTFPGADTRHEGILEIAGRGTIYLSDIAVMSQSMQSRLLRVLESGRFRRVGGAEDVTTSARILLGTSEDLHERVEAGHFRSELFFRISAYRIQVPALRDRGDDIIALARYFLSNRNFDRGTGKELAPEALDMLLAYDWPGNVRELRNAIERGVIVAGGAKVIGPDHFAFGTALRDRHGGNAEGGVTLTFDNEPTLDDLRAAYMRLLLERHNGNRRVVAGILGISERNTYRLLSKLNLTRNPGGV